MSTNIDQLLIQNSELFVEIQIESKKRRNANFMTARLMQLVYQFEQNLMKLCKKANAQSLQTESCSQKALDQLRKIQKKKK